MEEKAIMIIINTFIQTAYNLLESAQQVYGKDKIPSWQEIYLGVDTLQSKIDAAK